MGCGGVREYTFKTDNEMALFYETKELYLDNPLLTNEYIILKDKDNQIIDKYRWNGSKFVHLKKHKLNSIMMGKITPKDVYQECLIDALVNDFNDNCNVVLVNGKAGSGKSMFCLYYSFYALENGLIDKIYIIANPMATRNSAKMGFYPGNKDEKLLDAFLGNMLSSKLGSKLEVEKLIDKGQLELLPCSDIRGFETGKKTILYLPEAQNYDIDLMKLVLQRVGDSTKVLIDGDSESQVDSKNFEGENNGMKRVSEVFRGSDIYTEITLKHIYRSKIAAVADRM